MWEDWCGYRPVWVKTLQGFISTEKNLGMLGNVK
jgi:hypothetical protein